MCWIVSKTFVRSLALSEKTLRRWDERRGGIESRPRCTEYHWKNKKSTPHRGQIYVQLPMQNSVEGKDCTPFHNYSSIQMCPLGVLDSFQNFYKVSSTVRKKITSLKHSFSIYQKMALFHRFSLIFEKSAPHRVKATWNCPGKTVARERIVRLFRTIPT